VIVKQKIYKRSTNHYWDAGYTMNILQVLPGDVVVVLLAATWEAHGP